MRFNIFLALLSFFSISNLALAEPFLSYNGQGYSLGFSGNSGPIEVWEYVPSGQSAERWNEMFTIHKISSGRSAAQMAKQLAGINQQMGTLTMYDEKSGALCFIASNSELLEVNAWRYSDIDGETWGNALQWRYSLKDIKTQQNLQKYIGKESVFAQACEGMKTWEMRKPD